MVKQKEAFHYQEATQALFKIEFKDLIEQYEKVRKKLDDNFFKDATPAMRKSLVKIQKVDALMSKVAKVTGFVAMGAEGGAWEGVPDLTNPTFVMNLNTRLTFYSDTSDKVREGFKAVKTNLQALTK